jgi:hypothetical protein
MRTIELYRKHKAGEVSREKFLYEVRRDNNLPWVTNVTSYDDAVKILKNKGIISEVEINENYEVHYSDGIRQSKKFKDIKSAIAFAKELAATNKELQHVDVFKAGPNFNSTADTDAVVAWWGDGSFMDNKSKNDPKLAAKKMSLNEVDNNVPTDPAVDRVNPYFLKRGVQMLLAKEKELTNDSYIKALNKAALMLQKNPHAFDEEMFANAKDVEKADDKLEVEEVKKNNLVNKDREMKKMKGQNIDKANTKVSTKENKKGKPKGVQMMKEEALKDLYNSLKKKDLVNEDSHWRYNIGSEIHTPDGQGKVIEIVGGTFTVEMEDGSQKDYQFNTVQHFTEKAQEENILPAPERKLPDEDKPLDPRYKMNKDGQRAISPKGLEFRVGDEAIAVDNDQKIKIGSFKQSQGRIKAGFSDGINYKYIDIDGLEKPAGDDPWAYFKGKPFGEAVKQYIAKHKDDKEKMSRLKTKLKELVKVKDKTGDIVKLAVSSGEAQQFVNSQQPNIKSQLTITGK